MLLHELPCTCSKSAKTRPLILNEAVRLGVLDLDREIPSSSSSESDISDNSVTLPASVKTANILSVIENDAAMATALERIRMVVGAEPADDLLKSFLLQADMDVNRAVNYFFGIEDL